MKSRITLAVIASILIASGELRAEIIPGRWDLGLRAGANLSNVSDNVSFATDTADGLYAGVILGVGATAMIAVESGVVYASKGGKGEETVLTVDGPETMEAEANLDYLSVPVRVRIPLGGGDLMPYFLVGVEFGHLLSAELVEKDGSKTDVKERFEEFDFGTFAGVGFEIPVRSLFLLAEYSWGRGLVNVSKVPGIEGHNRTSQIVGGVKYRFGGRS